MPTFSPASLARFVGAKTGAAPFVGSQPHGGYLSISFSDAWRRFRRDVEKFSAGRDVVVRSIGDSLTRGYRSSFAGVVGGTGLSPLAARTLAKRRQGKRRGIWPSIPRYAGTGPLVASGFSVRDVTFPLFQPQRRGRRWIWTIQPSSQATTRAGQQQPISSMEILERHERGFSAVIPVSGEMLAYLRALSLGVAGPPEEGGIGGGIRHPIPGRSLVVVVPARPVFRRALAKQLVGVQLDFKLALMDAFGELGVFGFSGLSSLSPEF